MPPSMTSKMDYRGQISQITARFMSYQASISYACTLVLLALIAWFVGILFWSILTPAPSVSHWVAPSVASTHIVRNNGDRISELTNSDLFGSYSQESVTSEPVIKDAPQTRLNLTLVGAVASNNPKLSLAVIANQGKQSTYGLGETIDGTRVTLKSVLADRAIIDNQGRDETLMLEGIDYSKLNQNSVPKTADPPKSSSADLVKIREEISQDPQKIFQYIRLSQVMDEGKLKGYRVRPGQQRELFDSVGLQDGDIATVLNGRDLTDPSQITALWKDALSAQQWNLTVERDGQLHDIYIEF
ncbi:type II secretion system protein GspC [Vibrio sp. S17_S38]|uniref:type II secretion system protein GspC n=1 Tax=Vibrio sp. S17_S38 TaxID=2720229 RepID=UPI0016807791|nr:type II secretion system protein GspC [Vibrio sp. S17_S38]MBD1574346.1 type II secretion system protein GspC [Vibrio sp. S17_S38]